LLKSAEKLVGSTSCIALLGNILIGVRAREAGGCSPPDSGKTIIFRAKANFFGQKPAAKNEKNVLIKPKNGIHSV